MGKHCLPVGAMGKRSLPVIVLFSARADKFAHGTHPTLIRGVNQAIATPWAGASSRASASASSAEMTRPSSCAS